MLKRSRFKRKVGIVAPANKNALKVAKQRKKRTPRQILEDKLWEECKRIIRKRYQNDDGTWTCYTSGQRIDEPAKCQTGHGKPKGALPVRFKYDLRNLRPQCYHANIKLGGMSDIFIAKLEREKEGLEFLNESCVKIEGRWEIKDDQTMGSIEAFEFLKSLYEKYKSMI